MHVAPAGAPAWAMRLCQGIHVNFLPSQIAECIDNLDLRPVISEMKRHRRRCCTLKHIPLTFDIDLHTGGGPIWPSHRLWRDNPEQRAYNESCPPNKSCSRPAAKVMVHSGRWQRLPRAERLCQRCSCSAVDEEAHMIWGCPALIDQRVQHSELFEDSTITSVSDFLQ